jgi:hypothetical protein
MWGDQGPYMDCRATDDDDDDDVKWAVELSDTNKDWNGWTTFRKILQYQI